MAARDQDEMRHLAPDDLTRAYADIAFGYNQRFPVELKKVHDRIDETNGIALGAHGLNSKTAREVEMLTQRIEDIAQHLKAPKRTTSGRSRLPLNLRVNRSRFGPSRRRRVTTSWLNHARSIG